jgi:SAM-dependent methyltransferase
VGELSQSQRERLEIDFWTSSPEESPGSASLGAFTNKMAEGRVVLEKFGAFDDYLRDARVVLEVGGGQCWVSCMTKKAFGPGRMVIGSDIGPDAVASLPEWERIFGVHLDGAVALKSYEIPLRDETVDLVMVFAAAHHFGAHRRTLREMARVVKPGGRVLYLHEPGCRNYIYPLARRRVMAKRPVVPEDLIRYQRLAGIAADVGLATEVIPAPTTTYRGPMETLYYYILQRIPRLQDLLPCSVDIVMTKDGASFDDER